MPKVYNKHHKNYPKEAVYIGRGSPWGNPFTIGDNGWTREDVCALFEAFAKTEPYYFKMARDQLKGKDLVCYCAPKACHGDILLRIANEDDIIQEQQEELNDKTTDNNSD
jgi:hypothetical protein